jgi:undecaprenyl-diphosphatase
VSGGHSDDVRAASRSTGGAARASTLAVDGRAIDPVGLATALGARPYLLLGLMVGATVGAIVTLSVVVRVADRSARRAWSRAARLWRWAAELPLMRRLERRFPVVWRAMRRLSATEYLVLHLALGLATTLGALAFLAVAAAVTGGDAIVDVDVALAVALRGASTPSGVAAIEGFTVLGNGWFVAAVGVVVAVGLLVRRRVVITAGWTIALAGSGALNLALKAAYARPRPIFEEPLHVASGWSFPSGHAMGTFVLVGMGSYLGWRLARTTPRRLAIVSVASAWAVAMGFSRMYLGVHYLSDVVAGFAAGGMWLAVCISGLEIALRRPRVPSLDAAATPPLEGGAPLAAGPSSRRPPLR